MFKAEYFFVFNMFACYLNRLMLSLYALSCPKNWKIEIFHKTRCSHIVHEQAHWHVSISYGKRRLMGRHISQMPCGLLAIPVRSPVPPQATVARSDQAISAWATEREEMTGPLSGPGAAW